MHVSFLSTRFIVDKILRVHFHLVLRNISFPRGVVGTFIVSLFSWLAKLLPLNFFME